MKKFITFLIVLALLVSVGVFAVFAETQAQSDAVWCDHCKKEVPADQWTEWTVTGGDFTGEGHYYLSDTFTAQESTINIPYLKFTCLDLRGNTWITEGISMMNITGAFYIVDSVGGGMILTTGVNGQSGAFATVDKVGELNLFGGTIQHVVRDDISISQGGLIYASGTVNVSGGTVTGGVVQNVSGKDAYGGNIYLADGAVLNITGGTVSKGMATGGRYQYGGNIYATGDAKITISGGVVEDGYAGTAGGNIYIANAVLHVTGGEIRNGNALSRGGNIMYNPSVKDYTHKVQISGGTITGGVAGGGLKDFSDKTEDDTLNPTCMRGTYGGGNLYVRAPYDTLIVDGGVIDGDFMVDQAKSFVLSGTPQINLGKSSGLQFKQTYTNDDKILDSKDTAPVKADVSGLKDGAVIYVQANGQFTSALTDSTEAARILDYFKPAVRTTLSLTGNAIKGENGTTGYCPHCGELVTWTAVTSESAVGQHCYLEDNAYYSSSHLVISNSTVLDLNGYSVYCDGRRVIFNSTGATNKYFVLMDSWGGGKMEGSGKSSANNENGGVLFLGKNSTFELYSGTIRMSTSIADSTATSNVLKGGTLHLANSAKAYIHGGQITGGEITRADGFGGNIVLVGSSSKLYVNGGIIRSGTASKLKGGNIYSAGYVEINGGIILNGSAQEGGNIYSDTGATLKISGGSIVGGTVLDDPDTVKDDEGKQIIEGTGGNIYTYALNMTGGLVSGGVADYISGNIHLAAKNAERTISGGTIIGGKATRGGNIYNYGVKTDSSDILKINGTALVLCGETTIHSGNICLYRSEVDISGNAKVIGGKSEDGANIYLNNNDILRISGYVAAGVAENRGGNVYAAGTESEIYITEGAVIAHGNAKNGGNIYANNGDLSVTGGVIRDGVATTSGGNVYLGHYVDSAFKDDGDTSTPLPVISGGTAKGGSGGNIYFYAKANTATAPTYSVTLGNCVVENGTASSNGDNIYLNEYAKFLVLPEFAQKTTVYFNSNLFADDISLKKDFVSCDGVYSGTLLLENRSNLPKIITVQADPALVIATSALVMQDGSVNWYGSIEEAMNAYSDEVAYIQPGAGELTLPAGSHVVDLAGQNVTILGTAETTVHCFDSANTSFDAYGVVELEGPVLQNLFTYTVDGTAYITVKEDAENTYSFHCLDMEVSSVTVRPGSAGLYYSCNWNCDSKLQEKLDKAGVAVSAVNMPGADFAADQDTLYTQMSASDLELGKEYNSVLINNIFSATADNNATRGKTPIYVTPYVTLTDAAGNAQSIVCTEEMSHSLQSVLKLVEEQAYYANKPVLESFFQKWETAMADWGFESIGVKPQDDNTLRILMGGNSFAYYYVEELYGLLMENRPEGVEEVEVYNIYYSGRGFYKHWQLWSTQADGDYHLFKTDKNGRRELQPIGGWTLEEVLAMENWDYIGLQGTNSGVGSYADSTTWDAYCADLAIYAEELFGYIHEMFPYTQLLWHRTWAQEVGRITDSGFTYTEEYNERYDPGMQYICDYMTETFDQDKPYDLIQVNSGAAWKEARKLNAELIAEGGEEAGLLPYGGLCAMLARNTYGDKRPGSGDGQHDGDIGGGQLINAYMWYMTITGDADLTDNNYKPDYEMSNELWNMLKQACMTTYKTYYLQ